ncbi:MAG: HEPN domain-containing protein [Armatimonadetes bacterium]|nr:HEPN domain-containing protein [Armatimonadota bacterium]
MVERSKDWFEQAERDLQTARWLVDGGFHEWACFICQQAAEKAAKAVYQKLNGEAWGHAVAALLGGLEGRVHVSEAIIACGRMLDRFYIPARYPNSWERGGPKDYFARQDADDAIRCAEEILRFCRDFLAR